MKQIIVIPARMKGKRLPGKPLIKILGKTILWRVWDRCRQVHSVDNIYVATEDDIIKEYCSKLNINCIVTDKASTAIDRIKLFRDIIDADSYINVQGDEPAVNINDIKTILNYNIKYPNRVVFGRASANMNEFNDLSKAKVVCDLKGKLLYSSRAGVPTNNNGEYVSAYRAIWIYGFNKVSLDQYYFYKKGTPLETIEDNEIVRFLEIGIPVYCVDVIGDSWAVDIPQDLDSVTKIIKNQSK